MFIRQKVTGFCEKYKKLQIVTKCAFCPFFRVFTGKKSYIYSII